MKKWILGIGLIAAGYALARRVWRPIVEAEEQALDGLHDLISGDGQAVDHHRTPGVPPQTNDDYQDLIDQELAGTFPASDPPSGW